LNGTLLVLGAWLAECVRWSQCLAWCVCLDGWLGGCWVCSLVCVAVGASVDAPVGVSGVCLRGRLGGCLDAFVFVSAGAWVVCRGVPRWCLGGCLGVCLGV